MKNKYLTAIIKCAAFISVIAVGCPVIVQAEWHEEQGKWWNSNEASIGYSIGWENINDAWYYFDESGWMKTGWELVDGSWYYLNQDGSMKTGWLLDNNALWYYLSPNGDMKTGWLYDYGTWYYLNPDGSMKTGWLYENGKWYWLDRQSGAMKTGWIMSEISDEYYFANPSGDILVNCTSAIDGQTYLFDQNGIAVHLLQDQSNELLDSVRNINAEQVDKITAFQIPAVSGKNMHVLSEEEKKEFINEITKTTGYTIESKPLTVGLSITYTIYLKNGSTIIYSSKELNGKCYIQINDNAYVCDRSEFALSEKFTAGF